MQRWRLLFKVLSFCLFGAFAPQLGAQQFFHASFQGLGPGQPPAVVHLPNGDVVQAFLRGAGTQELTLVKTDACDEILWSKRLSTPQTPSRLINMVAHENEIYLAVVLGPQLPDSSLTLFKFTTAGNLVWSQELKGPPMYWYSLGINEQGYLFLNGNSSSSASLANVVVKLDPTDTIFWSNSYTQRQIWGMGVPDKNGGFLKLTGNVAYLLDANGQPQWIQNYDAGYQSGISPLVLDDGFVIFSTTTAGQNQSQAYKIDLNGNVVWSSPAFSGSFFSDAILLENQEILIASSGAGPAFDQTQLLWLDASTGAVSNSKWIPPNSQATNQPTLSSNGQGHLFLHSQLATATATNVDFLRIKPQLVGTEACQWQNANLNTRNEAVTALGNVSLPPMQALSFNQEPVNASLQNATVAMLKGCSNVPQPEDIELGNDTTLCPGETLVLNPNLTVEGSYRWSNGQQGASLTVTQAGRYWLEVEPTCGQAFFSDTIQVDFYDGMAPQILADQFQYQLGETAAFTLQNLPDTTVFWQNAFGDTNRGNSWNLELSKPGQQWVKACWYSPASCLLCDSLSFSVEAPQLQLPNAFTPNGDGLNDFFGPADGALVHYDLWVKDRFGKTLSYTQNHPWNGDVKGQRALGGVYVYELHYQIYRGQPTQVLVGSFTLLR